MGLVNFVEQWEAGEQLLSLKMGPVLGGPMLCSQALSVRALTVLLVQ